MSFMSVLDAGTEEARNLAPLRPVYCMIVTGDGAVINIDPRIAVVKGGPGIAPQRG